MRIVFLSVSLLFLILWIVFGFDSVIDNLFNPGNEYGVGFHYSTLNAMFLTLYISVINLQVGGLRSVSELVNEVVFDFKCVFAFINRNGLKLREDHASKGYTFHPVLDFMFSACLALLCLFVFEVPYVFMFNYYHYGDLFYPVYAFQGGMTLARNLMGFFIPLAYCLFITRFIYRLKLRADRFLLIFSLVASILFVAWVVLPGEQPYMTPQDISLEIEPLTWPAQKFFPQTVYIYLNVTEGDHDLNDIKGWHGHDDLVHLVNVVAKYMVFISVGYLFSVKNES